MVVDKMGQKLNSLFKLLGYLERKKKKKHFDIYDINHDALVLDAQ